MSMRTTAGILLIALATVSMAGGIHRQDRDHDWGQRNSPNAFLGKWVITETKTNTGHPAVGTKVTIAPADHGRLVLRFHDSKEKWRMWWRGNALHTDRGQKFDIQVSLADHGELRYEIRDTDGGPLIKFGRLRRR